MNKGRVETRVLQGGHDVPADKIVERYERTMNLLLNVIRLSDRAFLFDNSYSEPKLFATVEANEISIEDSVDFVPRLVSSYMYWISYYDVKELEENGFVYHCVGR